MRNPGVTGEEALERLASRFGDSGQELLPLDGKDPKVVPPFLVKSN